MALILVSGADGQLGRALRREAPAGWIFAGRRELDVTSRDGVARFFAAHRPSVVVNCAAFTDVDRAETERGAGGGGSAAWTVNCDGARNLAEACLAAGGVGGAGDGAALVHVSTDFVFDGRACRPYVEEDAPNPINFYGESKLAGERAVTASGCRGAIVRTSWLWSERGGFVRAILDRAATRSEIRVVEDQVGTPTAATSLAAAIVRMVAGLAPTGGCSLGAPADRAQSVELFHFCDGAVVSRAQWARQIISRAGLECRVVGVGSEEFERGCETFRPVARRPKFSALDPTKFFERYGR